MKTIFVVPDVHYPHHDRKLLKMTHRAVEFCRPDELIFIGDVFDFSAIGRYPHNAYKLTTINKTVEAGRKEIIHPLLATAGKECKSIFILGNHEDRLRKYLDLFAAPLGGSEFLDIGLFIGGDAFDETRNYGESYKSGGVVFTHGNFVRTNPGASVCKHLEFFRDDVVIGHSHRVGSFLRKTNDGVQAGYEIGHMSTGYGVPGWAVQQNWIASPGTIIYIRGKKNSVTTLLPLGDRLVLPVVQE